MHGQMGGRDLAGLDHLHAAKERIGNVSGTGQPGIFQQLSPTAAAEPPAASEVGGSPP
jgi:hypothetical protein